MKWATRSSLKWDERLAHLKNERVSKIERVSQKMRESLKIEQQHGGHHGESPNSTIKLFQTLLLYVIVNITTADIMVWLKCREKPPDSSKWFRKKLSSGNTTVSSRCPCGPSQLHSDHFVQFFWSRRLQWSEIRLIVKYHLRRMSIGDDTDIPW